MTAPMRYHVVAILVSTLAGAGSLVMVARDLGAGVALAALATAATVSLVVGLLTHGRLHFGKPDKLGLALIGLAVAAGWFVVDHLHVGWTWFMLCCLAFPMATGSVVVLRHDLRAQRTSQTPGSGADEGSSHAEEQPEPAPRSWGRHVDGASISDAIVTWSGYGEADVAWPRRDEAPVVARFEASAALDLLPLTQQLYRDYFDARDDGLGAKRAAEALDWQLSRQALAALEWCYTWDTR